MRSLWMMMALVAGGALAGAEEAEEGPPAQRPPPLPRFRGPVHGVVPQYSEEQARAIDAARSKRERRARRRLQERR